MDPALPKFAVDLAWLQGQGVTVQRFNLAQEPHAFAASEVVRRELTEHGNGCLPLVVIDGAMVSRGVYPSRDQLAAWSGIKATPQTELNVLSPGCCESTTTGSGPSKNCC